MLFPFRHLYRRIADVKSFSSADDQGFDAGEFEKALKSVGPILGSKQFNKLDNEMLEKIREEQGAKAEEETFRKYPFTDRELPILPDCNNYYSGKFGDYFWHQNADQVYVYIPISEDVIKSDIQVKFQTKSVDVKIKGVDEIAFKCVERIIPDGCFWVLETDKKTGNKFVQLDLEKRHRMINWNNLFGEAPPKELNEAVKRSEMLEKLFAANKGMSKFTGGSPESISEMMENADLMKMISGDVDTRPRIVDTEIDGDNSDNDNEEVDEELEALRRDLPVIDTIDIGDRTIRTDNTDAIDV